MNGLFREADNEASFGFREWELLSQNPRIQFKIIKLSIQELFIKQRIRTQRLGLESPVAKVLFLDDAFYIHQFLLEVSDRQARWFYRKFRANCQNLL